MDSRSIVVFLTLAVIVFSAAYVFKLFYRSKKQLRQEYDSIKARNGAVAYVALPLAAGLPLAENSDCEILLRRENVEINGSGTQFLLDAEKLNDIRVMTRSEIQNHYVSSAGGTVAGGMLFGWLGAGIGGRIKKIEDQKTEHFMIITYKKGDMTDHIAFHIPENTYFYAKPLMNCAIEFEQEFQKTPRSKQTVCL